MVQNPKGFEPFTTFSYNLIGIRSALSSFSLLINSNSIQNSCILKPFGSIWRNMISKIMVVSELGIGLGWGSWLYTVENLKGFQPYTLSWVWLAAGTSCRPCCLIL